jgi:hypothetical protein
LATYGADGKIQTVRHSMLSAMLLNGLHKQVRKTEQQARENQRLASQVQDCRRG